MTSLVPDKGHIIADKPITDFIGDATPSRVRITSYPTRTTVCLDCDGVLVQIAELQHEIKVG